MAQDLKQRVLQRLERGKVSSLDELARELGVSYYLVHNAVTLLFAAGKVEVGAPPYPVRKRKEV